MGAELEITYKWAVASVSLVADERRGALLVEEDVPPRTAWKESDVPALFREFTDLRFRPADVLAFAQRYGRLLRPQGNPKPERVASWYPRFSWMRHMVRLCDLVFDPRSVLSEFVHHEGGGWYSVREPGLTGDGVPKRWRGRIWWAAGPAKKPVVALRKYLNARVNEELERFRGTTAGVWVGEGDVLRSTLLLRPRTLWQCLVAQYVRAVTNGLMHTRCDYCRKWITLTGADTRPDRTTCSPSCRTGLWRLRKRAKALHHDEGLPVPTIALEMGRAESEIRDWISSK